MKLRLKPIHDQVVVLVGATSGIGLETANLFAEKGARVVIVGRSQEGLNDAVERVRTHAENYRMMHMGSMYGSDIYSHPGAYVERQAGQTSMGGGRFGESPREPGLGGSTMPSNLGETPSGGGLAAGGGMAAGGTATGGIPTGSTSIGSAPVTGAPVSTLNEQVVALEGDVTSFDQMRSVAEQVIQRFGRIDTWVNVAGIGEWALFEDTSPDEFRRIIDVNLVGHANGAMAALPYLRQQRGGSLIFVSSIAGRVSVPYQAAYSASKHGLNGMIDTLRMELKHTGAPISVTNIMPTSMNTPLFEKARTKLGVEPDPIPPVYDNTMVAKAIVYAAANPVRELIVGDAGIVMNFLHRFSPRLATKYMEMTGFRAQRSDEVKSAMAPDNLYEHLGGYNRSRGDMAQEMRAAPMTWLSTHPQARMAILGGLLAIIAGLIGWRAYKNMQMRRSWRYRLPRQLRRMYKQAGVSARHTSKSLGKTLNRAGHSFTQLPVVSELPMFHRPSLRERVGNTLAGVISGLVAILPFVGRRKPVTKRIAERLPEVHLPDIRAPWKPRQKTFAERITLADQRKVAAEQLSKASHRVRDQFAERRKDAAKAVEKAASRSKDLASKAPSIERRESFVERVTFKK
jgi:NAD(P)-dependent dehydrogenase (short-subunit alcohol dehydrogenase family)